MNQPYICCPNCGSQHVTKRGRTKNGKQRYCCLQKDCLIQTFILDYSYNGCLPSVKRQIADGVNKGDSMRAVARSLHISPGTVIKEVKRNNTALRILP